jgi:Protein of unknown function (DUF4242)
MQLMKRFVIEREVPGVGASTYPQLCDITRISNAALGKLLGQVQWEHSYVAGNKTFCVYRALSEKAIREHARISGFPANVITEIHAVIDPMTNARAA